MEGHHHHGFHPILFQLFGDIGSAEYLTSRRIVYPEVYLRDSRSPYPEAVIGAIAVWREPIGRLCNGCDAGDFSGNDEKETQNHLLMGTT